MTNKRHLSPVNPYWKRLVLGTSPYFLYALYHNSSLVSKVMLDKLYYFHPAQLTLWSNARSCSYTFTSSPCCMCTQSATAIGERQVYESHHPQCLGGQHAGSTCICISYRTTRWTVSHTGTNNQHSPCAITRVSFTHFQTQYGICCRI